MNIGLRFMSYLVKKLSALVVIVLLIVLAAFIAYDMANIYVVMNDGMSQRTTAVLNRRDPSELNKFFTLKYLNSDPLFHTEQYRDYLITDYDYKLSIKRLWVWPWQERTRVVVEEFIPESSWKFSVTEEMKVRLRALQTVAVEEDPDAESDEEDVEIVEQPLNIKPPQWQNGEKLIEFRKVDRQWKIDRIIFVRPLAPDNISNENKK